MTKHGTALPTAVVLNLDYAGLGIARSLSRHRIPVIALSTYPRACGLFTRRAKTLSSPNSRDNPEELLEFLLRLAEKLSGRGVLFPTCDHDLVFVDRFREQLEPYYALAIAERSALHACLDKWETYLQAVDTGVPVPKSCKITGPDDVERALANLTFPSVLKPLESHHWRKPGKWELVGARKACCISSPEELRKEYAAVARADRRALVQQMIPGSDESLVLTACYLDRDSNWVAGFCMQKLAQSPPAVGTGCIVQLVDLPELFEPTRRLLQQMRYTGIAMVEYKRDEATGQYMLIEVNARVWDQLPLGPCCGLDLSYLAYCELAGLPIPPARYQPVAKKWIAEDRCLTTIAKRFWNREPGIGALLRHLKGERIYAIWDWSDPLPAIAYFAMWFFPDLAWSTIRRLWLDFREALRNKPKREAVAVSVRHFERRTTEIGSARPMRTVHSK